MKQAPLNRADFLRCLANPKTGGPHSFARFLGFEKKVETPELEKETEEPAVKAAKVEQEITTKPKRNKPYLDIWLATRCTRDIEEEAEENEPQWFVNAVAFKSGETTADHKAEIPEKQPLAPWSRAWPVLREIMSILQQSEEPDMARAIDHLAEGKPLDQLPRKKFRVWSPQAWILWDRHPGMEPFEEDTLDLLSGVTAMRGKEGLRFFCLENPGDLGVLPPRGTPLLAISDMGCPDHLASWFRLGKQYFYLINVTTS